MKLELKSGRVGYVDQGSGPAVLLMHAFPLNKGMWAPQIEPLSNRFRVIAFDLRGFGESRPPSPWTMEDMADDINEFLDKLGLAQVAIVGVSIGGYIALTFWRKYAGRLRQLVISNSRARADNETEKAARNEMIAAIQQGGSAILPDRMLPRLLQANPAPEAVRQIRDMIAHVDASAAAYAITAMRDRMDFSGMLHQIRIPTMVIAGENDVIIRVEEAEGVAASIRGARFIKIPNSGHLSNLENPSAFNSALLSFLG